MTLALVVSNLLYPVVAVGVAALLCVLIVLRHRRPKSVEANMRAFHKGLRALAPEGDTPAHGSTRTAQRRAVSRRPAPLPADQRRTEPRRMEPRRTEPRRVDERRVDQRPVDQRPANTPRNSGGSDPLDGVEAETG